MMIRKARLEDMPSIVEMGASAYAEAGYEHIAPFCGESMQGMAAQSITDGVAFVASEAGELKGIVGYVVTPYPLNNAFQAAYEVLLWVSPEHRDTGMGVSLINAAEKECKERGVNSIHLAHMGSNYQKAQKLYELNGYERSEICYTKVM